MSKFNDVLLDDLPITEWPEAALYVAEAGGNTAAAAELKRRFTL